MGVLTALTGAGAVATTFGKGLIKNWMKRVGPEHARIFDQATTRWGFGVNFLPVVGQANLLYRGLMRGGVRSFIAKGHALKSNLAANTRAMDAALKSGQLTAHKGALGELISPKTFERLAPNKREILRRTTSVLRDKVNG